MHHRTARVITFLVCIAVLCMAPVPSGAADFEPLTIDQVEELVKANRGKIVMINFWATWCPPCREEIPGLIKIRKSYGEDKLLLIGASVDEDDKALRQYVTSSKINYPVRKAARNLVQAAGVSGIPHMLVFDGRGEVIGNAAGLISEQDLRNFIDSHLE